MSSSINTQVVKAVAWLSIFKILSQAFSWATTIFVARILTAQDYGLMEMATIFTGYIEFFVEFGISAAIINKTNLKDSELSSIFWFLLFWGVSLGASCLLIAPATAWYFKNESLVSITSTVGVLFIVSSMVILPRSLLHRELRFKEVGAIDAFSVLIACITMLILANNNAGVWTLLIGTIARELARLICLYFVVKFRPVFHFAFHEIKPILKFGFPVVASNSLFYIYNKSDRFFGGRRLGEYNLGFYAIALQLAAMPVEKILSIFQSAIFPAFSKLKDNKEEFNNLFLKFSSAIYAIILPLFLGGFLVAEQVIPLILGAKWQNSILPFKFLVIAQMFASISSPLSIIHTGRGKPSVTLYANMILSPLMFAGFYFSSQLDSPALLAIPWVSIYPIFVLIYLIYSLNILKIPISRYFNSIKHPVIATIIMALAISSFKYFQPSIDVSILYLTKLVLIGAIVFISYMYVFAKNTFAELKRI